MNRIDAYTLLSRELLSWQMRPYAELVALIGQPALEVIHRLGEEEVIVRVSARWSDVKQRAVRIRVAADGPSCWKLERLEESIVVAQSGKVDGT